VSRSKTAANRLLEFRAEVSECRSIGKLAPLLRSECNVRTCHYLIENALHKEFPTARRLTGKPQQSKISEHKANLCLAVMPSANALRLQIERAMESRFPAALSPMPQSVRGTAAVGIDQIDSLLSGGFPVGAISEITGPATSGRTCLALTFIAERTSEGKVCAWVDVNDALDPESAAANGVCLRRLLWVRCKSEAEQANGKPWTRLNQALRAVDLLLQAGGFAAIVLDMGAWKADSAGNVVSLSPGCGTGALLPCGAG